MSDMLEQAIIDAEALKEAAIKSAEQVVIEKYQLEVKGAVEALLEQDEEDPFAEEDPMMMGGEEVPETDEELAQQIPLASTGGENLCPCPGDEEEIEIDFDQLAAQMGTEAGGESYPNADVGDFGSPLMENENGDITEEEEEEEVELNEEDLFDLFEELTIDMEPTKSGWLQRPDSSVEHEIDILQTKTDVELDIPIDEEEDPTKELNEGLEKAQKQIKNLQNELADSTKSRIKYKKMLLQAKDTLNEANLQNAKLLYTNQTLGDISLNERQKNTIAEAISKAGTVEEAKTIFDTLQSTVGQASVSKRRTPKSLSEAVERRSLTLPRRVDKDNSYNDILSNRMKLLAGIK